MYRGDRCSHHDGRLAKQGKKVAGPRKMVVDGSIAGNPAQDWPNQDRLDPQPAKAVTNPVPGLRSQVPRTHGGGVPT